MHKGKRMTFSVEGKGKGFSIKRKADYNGGAQFAFGDNVSASPAGELHPANRQLTRIANRLRLFL
jgi:hypothetical protein